MQTKSFPAKAAAPQKAEPRAIDDKALAVLPLKVLGHLSDDDSGSYLGVGLADTLITRLSQLRSFAVRPTSSILKFSVDSDAFKAGRELGVRYVLDGNLRRAGRMLRVTVQLLDVPREATIWAQQFHSEADDVLKLEDDISAQVAQSLLPQLSGTQRKQLAKRGTDNEVAFQAYVRGRFHWAQFSPESLPQAKVCFERAIELDPHYALAYVGLADAYQFAAIFGVMPSRPAQAKMYECAEYALRLDDELGEAHATLGLAVWNQERDFRKAETHFKRAMEFAPSYPHSYEWYGALLIGDGHAAEGLAMIARAEEVDPLSLRTKSQVAEHLYQAGAFAEALAKADEMIELDRHYALGHFMRGYALEQLGRYDEAVTALETYRTQSQGAALSVSPLCFALMKAGRTQEARRLAEELVNAAQTSYVKPWFLAMTFAAIGEVDKAFERFEESFAEHDAWTIWFGTDAKLRPLHGDPRFTKLLRQMSPEFADKLAQEAASKPMS